MGDCRASGWARTHQPVRQPDNAELLTKTFKSDETQGKSFFSSGVSLGERARLWLCEQPPPVAGENIYAHAPVRITFYRLSGKSVFLTSIAAAASKRVWPPDDGDGKLAACSHTPVTKPMPWWERGFYKRRTAYFVSSGVNSFQTSRHLWPYEAFDLNPARSGSYELAACHFTLPHSFGGNSLTSLWCISFLSTYYFHTSRMIYI